jgi:hypothetical protein
MRSDYLSTVSRFPRLLHGLSGVPLAVALTFGVACVSASPQPEPTAAVPATGALTHTIQLGRAGDIPVPGDYDGDGATDRAVWRPSDGNWYIDGFTTPIHFGRSGDVPAPGDDDGDGTTDIAVWRSAAPVLTLRGTASRVQEKSLYERLGGLGIPIGEPGDVPIRVDFDGDGRTDHAVWRSSTGGWEIVGATPAQLGRSGDVPVPGDYDGDRAAEVAVWRSGTWYDALATASLGRAGDVPVPADYDGDGRTDRAVWRPATGEWHIQGTTAPARLGQNGDIPAPGDYDGDGTADIAVFRPSTGTWYDLPGIDK